MNHLQKRNRQRAEKADEQVGPEHKKFKLRYNGHLILEYYWYDSSMIRYPIVPTATPDLTEDSSSGGEQEQASPETESEDSEVYPDLILQSIETDSIASEADAGYEPDLQSEFDIKGESDVTDEVDVTDEPDIKVEPVGS